MRLTTILVGLVIVMTATTVWAVDTGHLTMTVGGSSTYTPTPGETFRVDVNIVADVNMVAWGMELWDETDAGYTMKAPIYYDSLVENYCDDPGPLPYNQQGWAVYSSVVKDDWSDGDDIDGVLAGTVALDLGVGATSGFAMFLELTAPSVGDLNTRIVLNDVYAGNLDFEDLDMTYDPLTLLPEPTAFWLFALGGLALLRRRR